LFTDGFFGKRRARVAAPSAPGGSPAAEAAAPSRKVEGASAHAGDEAARPEGLTIEDYAADAHISEAEVWRRLRRGDLVGRTHRGRLVVYSTPAAAAAADAASEARDEARFSARALAPDLEHPATAPAADAAPAKAVDDGAAIPLPDTLSARPVEGARVVRREPRLHHQADPAHPHAVPGGSEGELPPLPHQTHAQHGTQPGEPATHADAARPGATAAGGPYLALSGERAHNPEMALLLDHLSLAKEENREILRMTQESIRKVTELTDTIVEMKDSVIEAREAQIMALREQLGEREKQIKSLLQQKEDLEMLARTIAETSGS
jgi:hypothetical protein